MKAIWNNKIIAQSDSTITLEGNHYFPETSLTKEYFSHSRFQSTCPYKGEASYFNVNVDGKLNENAAWYYPSPNEGYDNIAGHVAFWHGVRIEEG